MFFDDEFLEGEMHYRAFIWHFPHEVQIQSVCTLLHSVSQKISSLNRVEVRQKGADPRQ